jgi:hypothetical protein
MSWPVVLFFSLIVTFVAVRLALRLLWRWLANRVKNDPEYQAEMARLHKSYEVEQSLREEASWFGATGLPDEIERELPKYLRREFGELVLDDGSLKASDLAYVGSFPDEGGLVHYWRIPPRGGEVSFAYVEVSADGQVCTGWGNREPTAA